MRDRISLLWSCSSVWPSLPSKKKYAIPREGSGLESLSIIEELGRRVFIRTIAPFMKRRLTIEWFYHIPLWNRWACELTNMSRKVPLSSRIDLSWIFVPCIPCLDINIHISLPEILKDDSPGITVNTGNNGPWCVEYRVYLITTLS